jgi:hypothetical protein
MFQIESADNTSILLEVVVGEKSGRLASCQQHVEGVLRTRLRVSTYFSVTGDYKKFGIREV